MRRYLMGNLDGIARVRASLPGNNAEDPALDPRLVAFDSSWKNALRWHAGGIADGAALTGSFINKNWLLASGSGIYFYKGINVPGMFRDTHTAFVLAKSKTSETWYQCAALFNEDEKLFVCPYHVNVGQTPSILNTFLFYYWTFAVKPDGPDPTEDSLSNSMLFGNHPTRGAGLFISRRGTDVLDADDDDLVLSTQKNYFQFHETGSASRGVQFLANNQRIEITLAKSYHDFPPIVAWRTNTGTISPVYAEWVNANTIAIRLSFTTTTAVDYRFAIIATDPTYEGGAGTIRKRRLLMSDEWGIGVTKKNIGYDEAGENDWIFRSDRPGMQFRDYSTIYPNTFAPGLYDYPVSAQSSSGVPLALFQLVLPGGRFVGMGWASSIAIRDPTNGAPREWIALMSSTPTQFRVQKDGSVSFSGIPSYAGVANVADF